MTYIDTQNIRLNDIVKLRNILNKQEEWLVITNPQLCTRMRGNLATCEVQRNGIIKTIYFNA